ncbi:hypothetical protein N9H60_02330 [Flavimaricola sp.]|nr:hypothetical protein [Flavimaricola sp.]MDA9019996.1 hypothetical protein [Flavimaricola sp.]
MTDVTMMPINGLQVGSSIDTFSELSSKTMQTLGKLETENSALRSNFSEINDGLNGPARAGNLTNAEMLSSLQRSHEAAMLLNENVARFSLLTSSLTTFGNNLSSFLKGQ